MKLNKVIFAACALAPLAAGLTSCNDDDIFVNAGKEAFIMGTDKTNCLYVKGRSGTTWYSSMSNDTIYIKVSPQFDVVEELDSVFPKFYISKGSTVTPDPALPQDFWVEGGVKYTITSEDGKTQRTYVVTHGVTDFMPHGEGFTLGAEQYEVKFPELGYPGEQGNYGFSDSRLYGDLNGYVAFCGHDHFVIVARQYTDPYFDNPDLKIINNELGIKVFNVADASQSDIRLNTGSINVQMIRAITSDWNGNMVAIVPVGNTTDIFAWTKPTDAPRLIANVAYNMGMATDGSNYIQACGDIFGTCNLTAGAQRGVDGNHYYIHLENGAIVDQQVISTGYSSGDCGGFQMISMLSDQPGSDYVIGDSEGVAGQGNTMRVYVNTFAGKTKTIMPNVLQSTGSGGFHDWWVGTGGSLSRGGARRPYVSAMPINGKPYVMLLSGTAWWYCNVILDAADLHSRVAGAEKDYSTNAGWSFGASGDWYYDASTHVGYWLGYSDRYGVYYFKFTCYE